MEKYNLTQTGLEVQEILDNATPQSELTTETQRAQLAEQTLQGNIDAEAQARANAISAETQRAQLAEQTLQTHIDNEALTRENADTLLQTNIGAEETRAKAAERQNADDIDALEALLPSGVSQSNKLVAQQSLEAIIALIPSAASALNQLADKAFVNSSIATNTATFRGTFNLVSDLHLPIDANHETIALNLLTVTPTADNNDYCFVQIPDSAETPAVIASTDRYKFNGTEWDFEYTLNTSGFTTAQWEAINSGITAAILESLTGIPSLIPSEATDQNQLADKAYVLTQILLATPAFKGQFTTLTQLQAVTGAKAGDLGIVRTKDTDGHDVFAFYQYKNDQWTYFYSLSYHPQDKPATTGLVGEAPYNGMGRVELPMNWVEGWPNDTWLYYPYNDVVYLMYYWNGLLYAPYNSGTQEGLGLDDNLVVKPLDYNIADIEQFVGERYLTFTESSGVWTITKPDDSTITSTELNNTNIYKINDPTHLGINVLTQAMLNRPNTIYIIQHDYDLNGQTITVPDNCVLLFEGGSLSDGNIVLQNTLLNGNTIFDDVAFSGTCKNDVLTPDMFGAVGDDVHDDTQAFKSLAAIVSAMDGGKVFIPAKTYLISEAIYFKGNIEIAGAGSNSILHLGNSYTGVHIGEVDDYTVIDSYLTDGDGTIIGKNTNNNDVTCKCTLKGDKTIKVSDASKFIVDELYVIQDTCDFSFDNSRCYYRQGEIIRVKSINTTNNTITLYNGLYGVYGNDQNFEGYVARPASERDRFSQRFITALEGLGHRTVFFKYDYKQINIHDFKIISDGDNTSTLSGYYGLYISNIINSKIDSIECISNEGSHVALRVDGAFNSSLTNSRIISDFTSGSDFYGCSLGDIQNFIVSDCVFGGRAHSLTTGSKSWEGAIINRNFIYERLTFEPLVENIIALDVHGGAELYTYRDICCPSYMCDTGGYYVTVENCHFDYISTSFHCSGLTVRNCVLEEKTNNGITRLLAMYNPWHDYSNDAIVIESNVFKNRGFNLNGQYTANASNNPQIRDIKIKEIVIRDNLIKCNLSAVGVSLQDINIDRIIIENNDIINTVNTETTGSLIIIYNRVYNTEQQIFIKNNNVLYGGISIGNIKWNLPDTVTFENITVSKAYIEGNHIVCKNGWTAGQAFSFDRCNAIIKGNVITAQQRHIRITTVKGIIEDNVFFGYNGVLNYPVAYFYDLTSGVVDGGIDLLVKSQVGLRNYSTSNIQANQLKLPFGTTADRPAYLTSNDTGYNYFDTTLGKNIVWNGSVFTTEEGLAPLITKGVTAVRPTDKITAQDLGFKYFDTNLNKEITFSLKDTGVSLITDTIPIGNSGVFIENNLDNNTFYRIGGTNKLSVYLSKVNTNPTADDLLAIGLFTNWGWEYVNFKNNTVEYPYFYVVNNRGTNTNAYFAISGVILWTEEDGAAAGVKRSGTTADRPLGSDIYVGFMYIDTTLGKPVYASAISGDTVTWVDATGATV